ncbi:MAG: DNA primase [Alphaproteobacteria bacterium]|nr:DNA primase [Alphaproteobacteria bacterium]
MALNDDIVNEIKARLSVSAVIGRRVKLQRRGREWVGLSPFSNEKTPSFTVNDEKGFYHCFSTGQSGDIFTFLMKTQNLSFPEALEQLAEDAGVELPKESPEAAAAATRNTKLREAVEAACAFFERTLQSAEGKNALAYLVGRGLSDDTIKRFRLGYAPNGNKLKAELLKKGYPEDVLLEARLIMESKEGRESFDFFRDRVMFPITDVRGRPIAFGGRVMGDGEPKYLNSPDTPLFAKGRILYGHALAKSSAIDRRQIIVCEGYMDVIALAQAGFANAVAPLGTALTESQLDLLWKMVPEPILCFDGDKAGQRAAGRAAGVALRNLRPGFSLQFALLTAGKDPDELIRRSGAAAMEAVLTDVLPLSEVVWRDLMALHPTDTPERRAGFEKAAYELASAIQDAAVRDQYRALFKSRIFELRGTSRADRKGGRTPPNRGRASSQPSPSKRRLDPAFGTGAQERVLLAVLINHPGALGHIEDRLGALKMADSRLDSLRQSALMHLAQQPDIDSQSLRAHLTGVGFARELDSVLGPETITHARFARPDAELNDATAGWDDTFKWRQRAILQQEFDRALAALEADPSDATLAAFQAAQQQLARLGDDDHHAAA